MPTSITRRTVAALAAATLLAASLAVGAAVSPVVAATSPAPSSAATAAADAPAPAGQVQYVALGDSYAAGFGVLPYSELPASGCFQADRNYPHLVAGALGLELDDRTCSGAVTANIRSTPQATITGGGTAPVQSDSLTPGADVVTVSIGGNDLGFSDVATACLAAAAAGPLLLEPDASDCRSLYVSDVDGVEVDALADELDTTVAPALAATFALIAEKAPNAEVFVVGYPSIAPDAANTPADGCFTPAVDDGSYPENAFPYTPVDTEYLHATEARLDAAIRTAAEGAGATYLSTLAATEGHSACSTSAPFIAGVTLVPSGAGTPTGLPGLSPGFGVLHPNEAGVAFLARTVEAAVASALDLDDGGPSPDPAAGPSASPAPVAPGADSRRADSPRAAFAASGDDPVPLVLAALAVLAAGGLAAATARALPRRS